jgi:ABC-2 type transport system permease protein
MASLDHTTPAASRRYWPIWQLTLTRLREFSRQPAAIFWVYGFPILMMMSLGIAFRDNLQEEIAVDLVATSGAASGERQMASGGRGTADEVGGPPEEMRELGQKLAADSRFKVTILPHEDWKKRLQAGKTDLVVELHPANSSAPFQLWDEPRRAESRLARYAVEAALLRSAGQQSFAPDVNHLQQAGSRYIDFLLPGMIGMGLMGGGLWGVGFVVVDMRVRKLLKRFLATPMRRSDFLLAVMLSRLVFTLGDIVVLLLFGYFVFGVRCQGSYWELSAAVLLGGAAFAGIGLLVASRAATLETVSGLMNLVMLPMWVLSGVFFSSERFPEAAQPLINLLPLTALNQALRGIMLEGKSLLALWPQVALLATYATGTFAVALRVFRWR